MTEFGWLALTERSGKTSWLRCDTDNEVSVRRSLACGDGRTHVPSRGKHQLSELGECMMSREGQPLGPKHQRRERVLESEIKEVDGLG